MRQQDRVLANLTQGPICAQTEWNPPIRRLAARIQNLKDDGWLIDTASCSQHSHTSYTIEYVLLNSPGVLQPELARQATPPLVPLPEQPIVDVLGAFGHTKPYGMYKFEWEER